MHTWRHRTCSFALWHYHQTRPQEGSLGSCLSSSLVFTWELWGNQWDTGIPRHRHPYLQTLLYKFFISVPQIHPGLYSTIDLLTHSRERLHIVFQGFYNLWHRVLWRATRKWDVAVLWQLFKLLRQQEGWVQVLLAIEIKKNMYLKSVSVE